MLDIQGRRISDHLNLLRGLAAVAVLVYHVRYRFFFDYRNLIAPRALSVVFYSLTAFGHDAVIVFFVMSGYFVSASVIRARQAGRWSWRTYAVNRLTRLYVVLLPGLLLTAFWDSLGLLWYGQATIYSGAQRPWFHDFFRVADRLSFGILAGNAVFLQTILVSPFGSNDPLWSLSYEFWYYALFPCACCALTLSTRPWKAAAYGVAFALLLLAVGKGIALYFPIWLLGFLLCVVPPIKIARAEHSWLATLSAIGLFGALLMVSHTARFRDLWHDSTVVVDYVTASGFAVLLYFIFHDTSTSCRGVYARAASLLAGCSYTLYVVHIPLLVFLRAKLAPDTPWMPDAFHVTAALALAVVGLAYAFAISRLTEARTDTVRNFVARRLSRETRQVRLAEPVAALSGTGSWVILPKK